MSKAVVLSSSDYKKALEVAQEKSKRYSLAALAHLEHLERAITIAQGVQEMRAALAPLMPAIMPLMNTPLGFLTDKDPKKGYRGDPYPAEVVVDCVAEALMRGFHVAGNEFNIIAGKFYGAQQGYKRLVEEIPGLTNLDYSISPPFLQAGRTCCHCRASWQYEGVARELKDNRGKPGMIFAVVTHGNEGPDNPRGKCERKMFKAIYELVTGTHFTESNVEDVPDAPLPEGIENKTKTQELIDKLKPDAWDGIAEVKRLAHLVPAEEFDMMLEQAGVLQVDQLTKEKAGEIVARLKKLEGKNA